MFSLCFAIVFYKIKTIIFIVASGVQVAYKVGIHVFDSIELMMLISWLTLLPRIT